MSDNIYKVLMGDNAPFSGLANKNYFDRTLRGVIEKIHYELYEQNEETGKLDLQQFGYRTVDIRWLEAKPYISTYVKIPEIISMRGYGLNYLLSVGDIVVASFDSKNYPIIQNIYSRAAAFEHGILSNETQLPELNTYGDPLIDTAIKKEIRPTPIRYILPGEISLTSLNLNNELYFDKYGTAKLIARVPNLNNETGEQCGDRLWEISLGQDIKNESNKEIKQSSFGNNVQFQILGHQNDCKVDFDSAGNIEVKNNGNNMKMQVNGDFIVTTSTGNSISLTNGIIKVADSNGNSITMNSSGIQLGDNANFSAVLGESLNILLTSMITIFNAHTHPGVQGGQGNTGTTLTPMLLTDILSKTIKLKQ